jgi:glycine/D-amino acid oxidase-like deaminating enzyme
METIWPALFERSTAFEKLKHLTGWAGLYEVSPDECAILGEVVHGEAKRFGQVYEAHSFSGHGVMHSYSAGMALAEKIVQGRFETLDASSLSALRFETGKLIHENLII